MKHNLKFIKIKVNIISLINQCLLDVFDLVFLSGLQGLNKASDLGITLVFQLPFPSTEFSIKSSIFLQFSGTTYVFLQFSGTTSFGFKSESNNRSFLLLSMISSLISYYFFEVNNGFLLVLPMIVLISNPIISSFIKIYYKFKFENLNKI